MLSEAQILAMETPELTDALKAAVVRGCRKMLNKDLVMLAIGAHEQSICHRLAVYLERFVDQCQQTTVDLDVSQTVLFAGRVGKINEGRKVRHVEAEGF